MPSNFLTGLRPLNTLTERRVNHWMDGPMTNGGTKAQRIIRVATQALEMMSDEGVTQPHTGTKIWDYAAQDEKLLSQDEQSELRASWFVSLSWAAQSDGSRIARQAGHRGYFLASSAPADAPSEDVDEELTTDGGVIVSGAVTSYQQREAKLYELLKTWLSGMGYRTGVVSKTRVGGTWRNPDIAGVLVTSNIAGGAEVEIATIEAKLAVDRVDQRFFEAVAHKRFSNRVYFALVARTTQKIPSDFRSAAERFKVGVLVVRMRDEAYDWLIEGDVRDLEVSDGNAEVEEYWPAAFEAVPPSALKAFLEQNLGIGRAEELYTFGINPTQ